MSLDAGKAQPASGRSRSGKRAMAVTAAAAAAIVLTAGVLTACGSSPGSPPSGVSLAGAAASVSASAPRTLSETGSSLMAPLFALWAPAYHARFSFTRWCGGAA